MTGRRSRSSIIVQRALNREKAVAKYVEKRTEETKGLVDEKKMDIQIEAFRIGWNTAENFLKKYKPKVNKEYEKAFIKSIDDEIAGFKYIDEFVEKMKQKSD